MKYLFTALLFMLNFSTNAQVFHNINCTELTAIPSTYSIDLPWKIYEKHSIIKRSKGNTKFLKLKKRTLKRLPKMSLHINQSSIKDFEYIYNEIEYFDVSRRRGLTIVKRKTDTNSTETYVMIYKEFEHENKKYCIDFLLSGKEELIETYLPIIINAVSNSELVFSQS